MWYSFSCSIKCIIHCDSQVNQNLVLKFYVEVKNFNFVTLAQTRRGSVLQDSSTVTHGQSLRRKEDPLTPSHSSKETYNQRM